MTALPEDAQHLRWLVIAHYVYAGFLTLWSIFGVFFIGMGFLVADLPQRANDPPPAVFRFMLVGMGVFITLMFLSIAVATFFAARNIARRKKHVYCLVMAGLDCSWFPIGTTLGALSFVVLLRPSVKALFEANDAVAPPLPDESIRS